MAHHDVITERMGSETPGHRPLHPASREDGPACAIDGAVGAPAAGAQRKCAPERRSRSGPSAVRLAMLVIDRDQRFLTMIAAQGLENVALTLCADASAAVGIARTTMPGLILLDLGDDDHPQELLIPRLVGVSPGADLILMSAHPQRWRIVAGLTAGACDYLPKDAQLSTLFDRIAIRAAMARARIAGRGGADLGRLRHALSASETLPSAAMVRSLIIDEALRRRAGNCSAAARLMRVTPQGVSAHVRKHGC